mgnify:CR=1 FL=1
MACFCTDKKKQDYGYIHKLANAESITKKIDIQIYFIIGYDGKTKYYDYEPTIRGRKLNVVETIRFSEPESLSVLPDIEQSGLDVVGDEVEVIETVESIAGTKKGAKRKVGKTVSPDSGTVLQGD